MNFIINDKEVNFELDKATIDFKINDGVLNFQLTVPVVPPPVVGGLGFDYTLDFGFL